MKNNIDSSQYYNMNKNKHAKKQNLKSLVQYIGSYTETTAHYLKIGNVFYNILNDASNLSKFLIEKHYYQTKNYSYKDNIGVILQCLSLINNQIIYIPLNAKITQALLHLLYKVKIKNVILQELSDFKLANNYMIFLPKVENVNQQTSTFIQIKLDIHDQKLLKDFLTENNNY